MPVSEPKAQHRPTPFQASVREVCQGKVGQMRLEQGGMRMQEVAALKLQSAIVHAVWNNTKLSSAEPLSFSGCELAGEWQAYLASEKTGPRCHKPGTRSQHGVGLGEFYSCSPPTLWRWRLRAEEVSHATLMNRA